MKITVRNTDGRLGTGVSAIEYTTQKDGGVSKTVKAAAPAKKESSVSSSSKAATGTGGASSATKAKRNIAAAEANRVEGLPSARPSTATLQNQLRQATVDQDTDAILRFNKQLKEERARQKKKDIGSTAKIQNELRQAQVDLDTDAILRFNKQLKEERARNPSSGGYSLGQGIADIFKKGANQVAQTGADTLAFAEDIVNAPFELFSGMELGSLRNSGQGIFNPLREKVRDEGTVLAEKSAENVSKGGKGAALLEKYGTATVAAVPQSVIAMLTGGTSAAAQTTGGVARAAAEMSPGIARTIQNAVGGLARNPQFWSSFSQVVGSGYQQALEDGASAPKAALYAVGNGLMNAAVEVGGGIQTLPGELQAGASGWRALVDSAFDEGKEEVIQGVIERAMQNLVYQKGNPLASVKNRDAVFNPFTAAEEFAGGAVVGGILSGGQMAANRVLSGRQGGKGSAEAETAPGAIAEAQMDTGAASTENAVRAPQTAKRDFLMETAARGGRLGPEVDMQKELERFFVKDPVTDLEGPPKEDFFLPEALEMSLPMDEEDASLWADDDLSVEDAWKNITNPFSSDMRVVQDGETPTIKQPYQGPKPVQAQKNTAPVQVDDGSVQTARNRIEGARALSESPMFSGSGFKGILRKELQKVFKSRKGVEVEGVSFEGKPYLVDINNTVLKKVINDKNLSAEKIALLDLLPEIVRRGNYINSSEYERHGTKKKDTVRFDYFETPVTIEGQDYVAEFDVESFPSRNNFRTYRIAEIKLSPAAHADAAPAAAALTGETTSIGGTSSPDINFTIPQRAGSVKSLVDGLGAADAGFTALGMEGQEKTSRMAESRPYDRIQEAATGMTKEEYNRQFRYQSQTEAKTTHLAEEMLYLMKDGKKTFLKDVSEDAYRALTESLREATAWNAEQMEAAMMIEQELLGRSVESDITADEFNEWRNTMREHQTSTGQGIQAISKWHRADNGRGTVSTASAVEAVQENRNMSQEQKKALIQEIIQWNKRVNETAEGDKAALEGIVLEIARERGTTTGILSKRLDGALRKAMDGLTFKELKQLAFSSTEALASDTKPLDSGEVVKTIQVLNMLSSLKTPGRNFTGNTFFYALDALTMDGAALLDMALSNATGTRSVAMGSSPIDRAMWQNAVKSAKMSAVETALDVDMGSGETMYGTGGQRTFRAGARREGKGGKVLNFTERMLFALERNNSFLLTVPDEFFKGMAMGNEARIQDLIDQGKIKTENANYAAEQADALAKYRTFQDTNATSAISGGIHDLLNLIGFGDSGKKVKGMTVHSVGLGDLASPFSRVAANLAARGVDYNPVTAVRGVVEIGKILYDAKQGKTIDPARQAKAVSRTARGISGTAVIGGFLALLSTGLIRRADDEGDENVAALNRSEGRTGYQFNLSAAGRWMDGGSQKWEDGDKLLDISSLQPFNELLGVADQIYHDEEKTPKSLLKDDLLGMMYAAADIPVLQTAGDLAKDLTLYKKDPVQAFTEATVNTMVSSLTPNILRSVAQGLDDRPRSVDREDGLWRLIQDEAKSRIPGLRGTLRSSVDTTGADNTYPGSRLGHFLNSTVNPMGLNTYQQTEQSKEWQRLREETGRTDFYPSKRIDKHLEGNGLSKDLSYEERQDFQRERGSWLMPITMQMMGNAGYQRAGAEQQSDLMADVRSFANNAAKISVLGEDSVAKWIPAAIQAQKQTGLSPSTVIYYRDMLSRLKETSKDSEANQVVRNAISGDQSMTTEQKNALDDLMITDGFYISQDKNVDYSDEDSFRVSQLSDSAVRHWDLVHENMPGITGEQYGAAWEISNRKKPDGKGYSKEEKIRFLREELNLTNAEARRIYSLMKKAIDD